MSQPPLIVAITGASGAPYAVRLLQQLIETRTAVSLIVSGHGLRLLQTETPYGSVAELREALGAAAWDAVITAYDDGDRGASPASGSSKSRGMVICPCSMGTVAAIAHGTSRSLIERAADVVLKERRKLVVVPRETPLSTIHLTNLLALSQVGAVVLPAAPGFYNQPDGIPDLVDFVVARTLDHFDIEHGIGRRWTGVGPLE